MLFRNLRSVEVNNKSNINFSYIGIFEKEYSIEEKIVYVLYFGSILFLGIILLEVWWVFRGNYINRERK